MTFDLLSFLPNISASCSCLLPVRQEHILDFNFREPLNALRASLIFSPIHHLSMKLGIYPTQAYHAEIATKMAANDVNDILVKLLAAAENVHGPVSIFLAQ